MDLLIQQKESASIPKYTKQQTETGARLPIYKRYKACCALPSEMCPTHPGKAHARPYRAYRRAFAFNPQRLPVHRLQTAFRSFRNSSASSSPQRRAQAAGHANEVHATEYEKRDLTALPFAMLHRHNARAYFPSNAQSKCSTSI